MNLAQLFSKAVVTQPGGCWEWTGRLHAHGYALVHVFGKYQRAHRIVWEWMSGPIPEGLCVLHHCDNRACINPAHLFVGTQRDNFQDALKKGRTIGQYGETHNKARVNAQQVLAIRREYDAIPFGPKGVKHAMGGAPVSALALKYGLTLGQICQIGRRHLWKQIPEEKS